MPRGRGGAGRAGALRSGPAGRTVRRAALPGAFPRWDEGGGTAADGLEDARVETTLAELATLVRGSVVGDGTVRIRGFNGIREAVAGEIAFLANPKYAPLLQTTRASAVIVNGDAPRLGKAPLLVASDPSLAFAQVMAHFAPPTALPEPGVHPTAVIAPSAVVGKSAWIGPQVVIGERSSIGEGCRIHAGAVIGAEAEIGPGSVLHPRVVLYDGVSLGARVIVHAGSVIGCDGFGYATVNGVHHKLPQQGTVVVEDDVEIGAGVTVDRARFGRTVIGRGTKIDNLVHVGHNVSIGEGCLLVAQVGIAGSTRIGRGVVLAGQTGVAGHLEIGDGAVIGARSGVTKSLPARAIVFGLPARPHAFAKRILAASHRLPEMQRSLRELQDQVDRLAARIAPGENQATHHP